MVSFTCMLAGLVTALRCVHWMANVTLHVNIRHLLLHEETAHLAAVLRKMRAQLTVCNAQLLCASHKIVLDGPESEGPTWMYLLLCVGVETNLAGCDAMSWLCLVKPLQIQLQADDGHVQLSGHNDLQTN